MAYDEGLQDYVDNLKTWVKSKDRFTNFYSTFAGSILALIEDSKVMAAGSSELFGDKALAAQFGEFAVHTANILACGEQSYNRLYELETNINAGIEKNLTQPIPAKRVTDKMREFFKSSEYVQLKRALINTKKKLALLDI